MEEKNNNGQTMKPNREYMKCAAGCGLRNENDKAVLGYLISQTYTGVYAENGCIAVPDEKLSLCTGIATSTVRDTVNRLASSGYIEVERPKVRKRGLATRYKICQRVMDKVAARNGGKAAKIVKRDDNMDQVNELKRQIQSLQAENDGLRLQLGGKDKRISELQARVDNAIKWWNETKDVYGKMKALEAENAELKKAGANGTSADGVVYDPVPDGWRVQKVDVPMNNGSVITRTKGEQFDIEIKKGGRHPLMRLVDAFGEVCRLRKEIAELNDKCEEAVRKEKAAANFSASDRSKANKFQDEIRELKAEMAELEKKYKAAVQELDELKGAGGMVTVEPGEPYNRMKVDEFM